VYSYRCLENSAAGAFASRSLNKHRNELNSMENPMALTNATCLSPIAYQRYFTPYGSTFVFCSCSPVCGVTGRESRVSK
jgi:hypothetical protein